MATSTLIQFLGDAVTDPSGIAGDTSNRRQVETFLASAAITAGQWVSFDYDKTDADRCLYVKVTDTSGGAVAIGVPSIGVALSTVAAGAQIRVVVAGYVEGASVATGATKGLALALDTTTSGRATIADAANVNICGIALEDAVGNAADCYVIKSF